MDSSGCDTFYDSLASLKARIAPYEPRYKDTFCNRLHMLIKRIETVPSHIESLIEESLIEDD